MSEVAKNLVKYRKLLKISQNELAELIGVSFQAISKWENGQAKPKTGNMILLSNALNVSIDTLMGHVNVSERQQRYDSLYSGDQDFYWGATPTELATRVLKYRPPHGETLLLDIACREGQNLLFFARNGYKVSGVEISEVAINKAHSLMESCGMSARIYKSSIEDYVPDHSYDICFCDEVLHLVKADRRQEVIKQLKHHTKPGGLHIISAPVAKPYIKEPKSRGVYPLLSGELFTLYHDWKLLEVCETEAIIINNNPYPRVYNIVVAQRPR